jgi:general secretion pathway protein F
MSPAERRQTIQSAAARPGEGSAATAAGSNRPMPVFEYTALDVKGKTTSGIIDADGLQAARQKLRSAGKFPVSVRAAAETQPKKRRRGLSFKARFSRVKASEVAITTRQLATLIGAGFPLVSAIEAMLPQTKSHGLKRTLAGIKDSIVEGNSFAHALSMYPQAFPPIYVNMVRAGESSGTLEIVLERLAEITEKQQALANRIQAALAYPIFMLLFGAVVLFILLTYIVPTITTIFVDMKQVLPTPTRVLILLSGLFKDYWVMLLALAVGGGIAVSRFRKTDYGRRWTDRAALRLPLLGDLARKLAVARFSRTLGSLLENGVTMLIALDIVKNIAGNTLIADAVARAGEEVSKGKSLWLSLSEANVFPMLPIQMIQVGEQSGEMEKMLYKIADVFESEVESSILRLTSYLEPVMILVMGGIVGFIVLSICLPIFEMNQLIR